ncbi:Fe-S cluster assembly protein NifU [Desulfonema ishimotonii]|uniref:Nitrogen fixation protein NifU n=1 Tax=Desulfonema ishimotonii TaxID=45657 RepID=A0A401FYB9_9BACT|nr:Fe-S cluster assembly protein NifU [Desulfonema ishimotonii]GBC61944.1 Fe-S cluster assembly protein NifU [Desulfonema ishimotonii]
MWEYTDKVKEHFLNPRNVGVIEDADGVGEVGSLACGDALKLTFKLDENERIKDVKFQTFGCASAIASSSALTELLKGKSLAEAEQVTNDDIANYLGGLPREKMHCSVMGQEALEKAIACYRGVPVEEKEGEIVCECFGVTDVEIRRALTDHHLATVEDVTNFIKAGGGCGNCHERIEKLIDEALGRERAPVPKPRKMTNIRKLRLIEETLEREIQPALKKDGGDIELVDVDGNRVLVSLRGACSGCSAAQVTLREFVEKKLREFVVPELVVEEVCE